MSPQPRNEPKPVRIEVPAEKVDNTLDLDEIFEAVVAGAEAAAKQRGAARPAPEAVERLKKLSEHAKIAAREFKQLKAVAPGIERRIRIDRPTR